MQPTNNSRPVMDVRAPQRPPVDQTTSRPTAPLPVREAPARLEDGPGVSRLDPATPVPTAEPSPSSEAGSSLPPQSNTEATLPSTQPKKPTDDQTPTPAGAIVTAILSMLILASIAVLVYLKS